jgi:YbbR domain-containing protein
MKLIKIIIILLSGVIAQSSIAENLFISDFSIHNFWMGSATSNVTLTSNEVPGGFYLGQNFPNPFNPLTNIYFSIPESQSVKITVSGFLGKEVAVVVNEKLKAGSYKADFDASNLSSGVYFYRLETEEFSQVRKMSLVK